MIPEPIVRLAFVDQHAAERLVAGVAASAHALALSDRQKPRQIWVHIANGGMVSPETVQDMRRACPTTPWYFELGEPAGAITTLDFGAPTTMDILRSTEKSSDGLISHWINRPVSRQMSKLLLNVPGIRPWHATMMAAAAGIAMLASFLIGGSTGLVLGAMLFQIASVLDGVDGEIARATYRSSARGAILDTSVDMITNVAFFVGITVNLTELYGRQETIVGGCALMLMLAGLAMMTWLARRIGNPGNFNFVKTFYRTRFPTGIPAAITEILVIVTSRDCFAFLAAWVVVLGGGWLVPTGLAVFAGLWCALVLLAVRPLLGKAPVAILQGTTSAIAKLA